MSKLKKTFKAKTRKPPKAGELIDAVENDDLKAVQSLLARGADINEKNIYGETPLICAAALVCEDIARLLIKEGAALDEQDDEGYTALMAAVLHENQNDTCRLLIDAGADLDKKDINGDTALMLAEKCCSTEYDVSIIRDAPARQAQIRAKKEQRETAREEKKIEAIKKTAAILPCDIPYNGPLDFSKPKPKP